MSRFHDVRAVVLAGGSGTRLWPLSRMHAPKQFLQLAGDQTLFEATVARLRPLLDDTQVLVVSGEDVAKGEGYRLLQPFKTLIEPAARNTAPAIGIAALQCLREGDDPVMVVLPSDHLIRDIPAFHKALEIAIEAARGGKLVTFGIYPTAPETGFGYIRSQPGSDVQRVLEFREKPDRMTAEQFLASGDYFWNSGMFVWRASAILAAIREHVPQLGIALDKIRDDQGPDLQGSIRRNFAACPSVSIDKGVLEKSADVFMVPGKFGWSDVGSWDAVYDVSEKDAARNVEQGNVLQFDCKNSHFRSESRLIAAVGVENISVIETADAILVSGRGESQHVRKIVDELVRRQGSEHVTHLTVRRPWGSYTVLGEAPGYKIKRIEVNPGGRLSLQSHAHRSEHWVVLSGVATVTRDQERFEVRPNESTFVPLGARHRLENLGGEPVQIIEVQVGERVVEEDITRYDDVYGREPSTSQTQKIK